MTDVYDRLKAALSDRYTIQRELGAGGMAVVYLAHDIKHERNVAIKVLRPELAAALGVERFHQEIKIAANLHHPHILPLYDSGDADGFLYYVMPYEEGRTLRDRLAKEGELPIPEAVRILRDIVEALSHAHKHNVVHRDIKPDNVMLSEHHALVTDFGVAKAVSEATGRQKLTTAGVALGTPAYMAPEQAAADPHIDHRADIYAVGAVAYELLTGRPPFTGTTQQEILAAHVTQTADPVTKYRETVPPALEQLVQRCLEKKAADRWQTAEELLPQLEALATPSGGVTPTGMLPVVAARRGWKVTAAAGLVAVILAVVLVVTLLPGGGDSNLNPNLVAVAVFRNATGDPSLDQVGERAAHWITQGLQQATIKVTPWDGSFQAWQYVQSEVDAGRVREPIRPFAEETGAGTVVSGVVYLENDSLEIRVNVTDAVRGQPLGAVDPVRGPRESMRALIGGVEQGVLGFLAISFDERISSQTTSIVQPPSFHAYQEFDQGLEIYLHGGANDPNAIQHFFRAFALDTSFVTPLIYTTLIHFNRDEWAQADSVVGILEGHRNWLSEYDGHWLDYLRARVDGDNPAALRAIRRAAELAPGSKAAWNWAHLAMYNNRPREAVDALLTLDPERGPMRGWRGYFEMLVRLYLELGELENALDAARQLRATYGDAPGTLGREALALAALGRVEELDVLIDDLVALPEDGLRQGRWMMRVAVYLRRQGHTAIAQTMTGRTIQWLEARTPDTKSTPNWGYYYFWALYAAGRCDEAYGVAKAFPPETPYFQGLDGLATVCRGDREEVLEIMQWLESVNARVARGANSMGRAMIAGALGDGEHAVALWRQASAEGYTHPAVFRSEWMAFEPIDGYEPWQELMRPKG